MKSYMIPLTPQAMTTDESAMLTQVYTLAYWRAYTAFLDAGGVEEEWAALSDEQRVDRACRCLARAADELCYLRRS